MAFYKEQSIKDIKKYQDYLKIVGSLSNLFSNSNIPYLYYRIAEKMFCKAFSAEDLSRADVSYDACKNSLGIGIKTFLRSNNKSLQKVAEFNKDLSLYQNKKDFEKIEIISKLRNSRLEFTNNLYNINKAIYHCIVRDEHKFLIFEEDIKPINIEKIKIVKSNSNSISFEDDSYEYSFSISKSTLLKRFSTNNFLDEFDINILKEPLDELYNLINSENQLLQNYIIDTAYLPLYGRNKQVYSNSGLNQWNAKERAVGKPRDKNEVYIPIPAIFYKVKPNFFPNKDIIFSLNLPNKKVIKAKICQSNGKALMSNPNKDLGEWLLRDVFKLKDGVLVTNELLDTYGIDSVRLDKLSDYEYNINFSKKDSFENFINSFN